MYKHFSCAAFKIKLTTGSGNAGTCEKLHDRSRIRLREKAGVCASALNVSRGFWYKMKTRQITHDNKKRIKLEITNWNYTSQTTKLLWDIKQI
jgi:hypothetical protein